MKGDSDVRVEGDDIVGSIEGYMEEVRVKKRVIDELALKRGHGGWTRIALPDEEVVARATGHSASAEGASKMEQKGLEIASTIDFADTLCMVSSTISLLRNLGRQLLMLRDPLSVSGSFDRNIATRRTFSSEVP
jgi:hypothetical protein